MDDDLRRTVSRFGRVFVLAFVCSRTVPSPAIITAPTPQKDRPHLMNFTNKYGQWGRLDWTSDRLTYLGDLPVAQGANAFFQTIYAGFTCIDGNQVPAGSKDQIHSSSDERLRKLAFVSVSGDQSLIVELEKKKVEYRGDLAVDAKGREFFDEFWVNYHSCFGAPKKDHH